MIAPEDFRELYQCDFTPTERDTKLRELAQSYVSQCEAYDRTVCTGPVKNGEIIPMGGHELGLVNRNARQVLWSIVRDNPEFSRNEILHVAARLAP